MHRSAVQDSQKIFLEYTVVCLQYVSIVITNQKYDNESHYQTKIFSGTIEQSFESTLLRILYIEICLSECCPRQRSACLRAFPDSAQLDSALSRTVLRQGKISWQTHKVIKIIWSNESGKNPTI